MTLQAPLHVQRTRLPHQGHGIHLPMTGDTPNSFFYMDAMVKIHKVRQVMDARPDNGLAGTKTLPYRLQDGTVRPDLCVAGHTRFRRRQARKGSILNGSVAIP